MYKNYLFSSNFNALKGVAVILSRKGVKNIIRKTSEGWSLEAQCSLDTIKQAI